MEKFETHMWKSLAPPPFSPKPKNDDGWTLAPYVKGEPGKVIRRG